MKKITLLLLLFFISKVHAQLPEVTAKDLGFGFTTYNEGQAFTAITVDANGDIWAGADGSNNSNKGGVFLLSKAETPGIPTPTSFTKEAFNSGGYLDLSKIKIQTMKADALGNIWIGHSGTNLINKTLGGLDRIDVNSFESKHYIPNTDVDTRCRPFIEQDGNATNDVKSIAVSHDNTVWLAQNRHGSSILTPGAISRKTFNATKFTSENTWSQIGNSLDTELPYPAYTCKKPANKSAQFRNMQAISADSTEVWVGSWEYITLDKNFFTADEEITIPHRILRYKLDGTYIPSGSASIDGKEGMGITYEDMNMPKDARGVINNIYRNNSKGVWVTTSWADKGFAVYLNNEWTYMDPTKYPFNLIIPKNTQFNNNAIWGNEYGNVFMGTTNGLLVYDGRGPANDVSSYTLYSKTNVISGSPYVVVDENMVSNKITAGVSQDDDTQWMATDNGIMTIRIGFIPTGEYKTVDNRKLYTTNPRSVGNEHINFVVNQINSDNTFTGPPLVNQSTYHYFEVKTVISHDTINKQYATVENVYHMMQQDITFQALTPVDMPTDNPGNVFLRNLSWDEINTVFIPRINAQTSKIKTIDDIANNFGETNTYNVEKNDWQAHAIFFATLEPDNQRSTEYYQNKHKSENPITAINGQTYKLYHIQKNINARDVINKNYESTIPLFDPIKKRENCFSIGLEDIEYDPIILYIDNQNYKMVNYTKEGHLLYPGKITRTVHRDNETGEIYVLTQGEGFHFCRGELGSLVAKTNSILGSMVFKNTDLRFKKAFQSIKTNR